MELPARGRADPGAAGGQVDDRRPEASVPRTTAQAGGAAVARAIAERRRMPAAVWGIVMLVASEAMLFASFIASYYYLWSQTAEWPPAGIERPRVALLLVPAICLAAASVPMQLGSMAGRAGRARAALGLVVVAFLVQCAYIAVAMHSFLDDLDKFKPSANAYASIYYVLLGADHAHVFIGLLLSLWLIVKLARGLTMYRANALQGITWYWHAVNLLTLIVVGTILSATL